MLNGFIVANEIRMFRTVHRAKTGMIIEGGKDRRVYAKAVDLTQCEPFVAGCRRHVEDAVKELKRTGEPGVLGVVDADTDHLDGVVTADPDLLVTETRDLEGLILATSTLKDVLIEHDLAPETFGAKPEMKVALAAAELGYVRWVSGKRGWLLSFPEDNFGKFINPRTLNCNSRAMCTEIAAKNRHCAGITATQIEQELVNAKALNHDPLKVARGHDVTAILAWAIRKLTKKERKDGAFVDSGLIETHLRLTYTRESFKNTSLFKALKDWEGRNAPYTVLL
jgi:hypothetical protein